ncbi:MAG: tetratricopeptide repeat protein [Deltaproteobacteria bacterium]|nr:tetratricopeptide repeat protein [Deltaproteobacteria bacterium]
MKRLISVIAGVCLAGGLASAQQPSTRAAEDEFNKGNTAYNLGKWDEAIDHFTKAYEALPQPEFLYNIAQAHRQAGNCKQATYFYKRFLSLKEHDKTAPLSAKTKADIDRFIAQLSDCAAKQESSANAKPDTTVSPPPTTTPTTTTSLTPTTATPTPAKPETTVATADKPESEEDDDTSVKVTTETGAPQLISLRAVSGVARLSSGDLDMPVQPTFALAAGYPLMIGPLELDLGVGGSYTPLPYQTMVAQKRGMMLGARAVVGAAYAVTPAFAVRGELGGGIVQLGGLEMGNPLVTDRSAKSFTLPNVRVGVAADYLITKNIVATVAPFTIGYSPGNSSLYGGSLLEIDVLVGIGYRQ